MRACVCVSVCVCGSTRPLFDKCSAVYLQGKHDSRMQHTGRRDAQFWPFYANQIHARPYRWRSSRIYKLAIVPIRSQRPRTETLRPITRFLFFFVVVVVVSLFLPIGTTSCSVPSPSSFSTGQAIKSIGLANPKFYRLYFSGRKFLFFGLDLVEPLFFPHSPPSPPQNLTKLFILVFICQPFGRVLIL